MKKGNPDGIKSYDDQRASRSGRSPAQRRTSICAQVGADVIPFQTDADQFSAVATGRVSAIVDDDTKINLFLAANEESPMELLEGVEVPTN